jgi:hypothetical protein
MALALPLAGATLSARTSMVPLCPLVMALLLLPLALEMQLVPWSTARATALLSMLRFDLWMVPVGCGRLRGCAIESYDFMISEPFSGISSFFH